MLRCTHAIGISALMCGSVLCAVVGGAPTPLTTKKVASGLSSPVAVTFAPGDNTRAFIVEQPGRIRILDLTVDPHVLVGASFLDITGPVLSGGERGLLGLAFHPDYASNGFFYVNYTGDLGGGDTFVSRFHTPAGTPNDADEGSETLLLRFDQPQSNHNGGWIGFGPDGYLYIGTGDGGNFCDQGSGHSAGGNSLDITNNLLGKMLRIDVDGADAFPADPNKNYAIPPTNPFDGISGDLEIWSYGLRNPWRNAFDSVTGELYIADVGQGAWEEINIQPTASAGGENYGWVCREGNHPSSDSACSANVPANCGLMTFTDPVHEYSHGDGCSVTGGEVYHGLAVPDLDGTYFFGDYCTTTIWSFVYTGGPIVLTNRTTELEPPGADTISNIGAFGRDADGEVYICDHSDGEVYKIVPATPAVPSAPTRGDDVCVGGANNNLPCSRDSECSGGACGLKNRFVTVRPASGSALGIQVTLVSLDPNSVSGSFDGQVRWVGAPTSGISDGLLPSFSAAPLQCTIDARNWSTFNPLHIYGSAVVPNSLYDVRTCTSDGATCSSPLRVETAKFGDIIPPTDGASPNFQDINSIVEKFQNKVGQRSKTRVKIQGQTPDPVAPVNFLEVSADVKAFQSVLFKDAFPAGPQTCP